MQFPVLGLILIFITSLAFAQGRKPAVEDFVGIDIEHPETTPHGSDSLFNLEQDINQIKNSHEAPKIASEQPIEHFNWKTILGAAFILSMPLVSLVFVMRHLRRKATLESESNLKILENYRKERQTSKSRDTSTKKAS